MGAAKYTGPGPLFTPNHEDEAQSSTEKVPESMPRKTSGFPDRKIKKPLLDTNAIRDQDEFPNSFVVICLIKKPSERRVVQQVPALVPRIV